MLYESREQPLDVFRYVCLLLIQKGFLENCLRKYFALNIYVNKSQCDSHLIHQNLMMALDMRINTLSTVTSASC